MLPVRVGYNRSSCARFAGQKQSRSHCKIHVDDLQAYINDMEQYPGLQQFHLLLNFSSASPTVGQVTNEDIHIITLEQPEWPAGACRFYLVLVILYFTSSFWPCLPYRLQTPASVAKQQPYREYQISFHNCEMSDPLKKLYVYKSIHICVFMCLYIIYEWLRFSDWYTLLPGFSS